MKLSNLILAASIAIAPAVAFAQSSPSPDNQSGPGVNPTTPAPTDQGVGSESGNIRGVPSRGTMGATPDRSTTGSGMGSGSMDRPAAGGPPSNTGSGVTKMPDEK